MNNEIAKLREMCLAAGITWKEGKHPNNKHQQQISFFLPSGEKIASYSSWYGANECGWLLDHLQKE